MTSPSGPDLVMHGVLEARNDAHGDGNRVNTHLRIGARARPASDADVG